MNNSTASILFWNYLALSQAGDVARGFAKQLGVFHFSLKSWTAFSRLPRSIDARRLILAKRRQTLIPPTIIVSPFMYAGARNEIAIPFSLPRSPNTTNMLFRRNLISKYDFWPVKFPGLSRNGTQELSKE